MKNLKHNFEEVSLVYRNKTKAKDRPKVMQACDAYEILISNWDKDQLNLVEEFKILLLDNSSRLMSIAPISKGGMTEVTIDLRIIFATALKRRSNGIILAHNHPSGNLIPSSADIEITKKITKAGKIMNIEVLDHLILTENGFHSIASDLTIKIDHE